MTGAASNGPARKGFEPMAVVMGDMLDCKYLRQVCRNGHRYP